MNASSPSLPPSLPSLEAISCPPSAPPPSPPPDFSVWSQSVPAWAWAFFVFMMLFATCGMAGMCYILHLFRQDRRRGGGLRIPDGTALTLAEMAAKRRRAVSDFIDRL